MKSKKCKTCGMVFTPTKPMQSVCNFECALKKAVADRQKASRKQYLSDKKRIKTRQEWLKEAQAAVNKYIRLRDAGRLCISCGRWHKGQWQAGHYRSIGANPELRFDETNIHKQCAPCNNHLSGNLINFRIGLIARYGAEYLEKLEGPHEAKHYTIEEIEHIKTHYSKLARELERCAA